MYDEDLIDIAFEAANEIGLQDNVNEGTLAMLGGPTFETPAELRMFKTCGVDAVGKNTQISKNNSSRHIKFDEYRNMKKLILNIYILSPICRHERRS